MVIYLRCNWSYFPVCPRQYPFTVFVLSYWIVSLFFEKCLVCTMIIIFKAYITCSEIVSYICPTGILTLFLKLFYNFTHSAACSGRSLKLNYLIGTQSSTVFSFSRFRTIFLIYYRDDKSIAAWLLNLRKK